MWNRRQFLAAGLGATGTALGGASLAGYVWPFMAREDLIPGVAPTITLQPQAWRTADDVLRFVAIGDNGSGGRQAMAVASRMAHTYGGSPFGLVVMLGDICYYGKLSSRFDDVFERPLKPLIDAGVSFELAIGNHDAAIHHSEQSIEEIELELAALGTPGPFYATSHGPADFFYLDSSVPGLFGSASSDQLEWLDSALASSDGLWRIVALHHPPYSSGYHGSTAAAQELLVPILRRHRVDLVLSGHDHDYERTVPLDGITYVVSGGGCKRTPVGRSRFTATSGSILQFLLVDIVSDHLTATCITPEGGVADHFELRARR